ncbi:hypothetical protein ES319_D12G097500v1 [Gossypium barbadense]|uniref:BHLH domain-containing protein n=1 Tax=Gossypium barbadense TaxID=3634 RepID=A0A5J5NW37_GOSBA|nr:hypothetical protein ES319_D12G097500v1 [Gossypium barbadense]
MAYFGGLTENPRRFSRSEAPPGGGAVKKGMIDYSERQSGGSGNMIRAAGENGTTDDQDCESEFEICPRQEGLEALVDEAPPKSAPSRSSSKRNRAAEVHNLSEKRRRSRINEKMKALQNLVPNANKTDKASMLDEVIEYLKHLQLQVRILSMRNGLSMHPMCLAGVPQPVQFSQTRIDTNASFTVSATQETQAQMVFDIPNQCRSSNPELVLDLPNMISSNTSVGLEFWNQSRPMDHFR